MCVCVNVSMCVCIYIYICIYIYTYCKQTWNTGRLRLNYPVLEGAWRRLSFHTKSIAFSRFILTAHMHALSFRLWQMLTNMCPMPMKSKCHSSCHSSIRAPFSETEGIILRGPKLSCNEDLESGAFNFDWQWLGLYWKAILKLGVDSIHQPAKRCRCIEYIYIYAEILNDPSNARSLKLEST